MVTYERNGVEVDHCRGCQGLFLDQGELERLVRASSTYHEHMRHAAETTAHETKGKHGKKKEKKSESFIEEILDFII
jgi:Zn-finger nucleic acid-binding protein